MSKYVADLEESVVSFISSSLGNAKMMDQNILCLLMGFLTIGQTAVIKKIEKMAPAYDYIVVGAGTAGSVVGARLSENKRNTVLVLEAGGDDRDLPTVEVPAIRFSIPDDAYWNYETEPQENALLSDSRRVVVENMGKLVGGTSSVNAMAYYRGFKSEYDNWERLGANGWSYNDVLPYFLKSERNIIPELQNSIYHSTCGPLTVTNTNLTEPINVWFDAARDLGIPDVDCNQPTPLGICRGQVTINSGKRASTSAAFLWPAIGRLNLDLLPNALVTRVLITRNTRRAAGVEFLFNGQLHRVRVRKEVILSAGSNGTPKILHLSGIGPRNHLRQFRIPVVADLPVGDNYQIQPEIVAGLFLDLPTLTVNNFTDPNVLSQYIFRREGLLADKTTNDASLVFQKTDSFTISPDTLPDYQMVLQEGVRFGVSSPPPGRTRNRLNVLLFLLHPKSRGTLRLRSRNPLDLPRIDPRLLSNRDDVRDLVLGIRRLQSIIAAAPSLREVNAQFEPEPLANCSHLPINSNQYWTCYVRFKTTLPGHPVGTCRMGNVRDPTTVVGPDLRVKGIRNIRVADASIIPEVAGLTYATAIMIGEKASDLIKDADRFSSRKNKY